VKHIGIVACSAEGADLLGPHRHPEISMHTHALGEYTPLLRAGDWDGIASLMLSSAEKLARAGADFLICPDNTIHQAFDRVEARSPRPWLHIAREVAAEAVRRRFRCLGVLGTRSLMEGPVYMDALTAVGCMRMIPRQDERVRIDAIIFDELVYARFTDESRQYFRSVIARLAGEGCDAAVLGCTEIPLLIDDTSSPLPTLDSTRLLARAALRTAVE
jgi:aspartate racemase